MDKSDRDWINGFFIGYQSAKEDPGIQYELTKLRRYVWQLDHKIATLQNKLVLDQPRSVRGISL